eukprot:CAMPEP_0174368806 /NCGR_PEP_ID=MMETSP0811_2-20130205/90249_1 /TAXON_ID=73025 ORGANISM="Eutreptiella gymnastica-like, Strain CCMP1594" /NCGR_SAMPLE_ID=MMETSP0811_2 /ASSEMBLY_ACC=CAM_ASM_000667 /LENGTH=192 /DNA_ID=CAMNT_0015512611 /DNA_START=599 /DNA_END=1177 /DNA_ORIENTATION=-
MTPAEKFSEEHEFEFAWQYAILVTLFTIIVNYSYFMPWLAGFGFLYLFIKYNIQKHHLCTHLYNNIDSMDKRELKDTVDQMLTWVFNSLLLTQAFLGLYMFFSGFPVHALLMLLLVIITLVASYRILAINKQYPIDMMASEADSVASNTTVASEASCGDQLVSQGDEALQLDIHAYSTPHLQQILERQSIAI